MRVVALYSIKGGVGKTAAAVNLACLCATEGERTLLWDLDPQGASSYYLRVKPRLKGGAHKLASGDRPLSRGAKGTDYANLDVLPADFSHRHLDLELDALKKPKRRFRQLLESVQDDYDWVFIDCAPSISLVSESVFRASTLVLTPVIPTTLSLRTHHQLLRHFREHDLATGVLQPFYSMVDRRKAMHRVIVEKWDGFGTPPLSSVIPYSADVERMGERRAPLVATTPRSPAAAAYHALWEEARARADRLGDAA